MKERISIIMFKSKKIGKIISFAIIAAMLCGALSFGVAAAGPIVIDFSKYDYVEDILGSSSGGQGEFEIKHDGDRVVLFAECIDGYDPADDEDGTSTKGDLYATINDFGDLQIDASAYKWMKMSVKNESAAPGFEFHFDSPSRGYHVETSVTLDINPNSDYTAYVFNIPEMSKKYYPKRPEDVDDPDNWPDHWQGVLNGFRLDFMYYEESGGHAKTDDKIYIEYIAFFDSEQAANDFAFTPARTVASVNAEKEAAAPEAAPEPEAPPAENNAAETPPDAGDNVDDAEESAAEPTTTAASSSESDGGNTTMIIIIIVAAVAVVAIIVIVVMRGKGKK